MMKYLTKTLFKLTRMLFRLIKIFLIPRKCPSCPDQQSNDFCQEKVKKLDVPLLGHDCEKIDFQQTINQQVCIESLFSQIAPFFKLPLEIGVFFFLKVQSPFSSSFHPCTLASMSSSAWAACSVWCHLVSGTTR